MATCYIGETSINGEYVQNNITNLMFRLPINCNPGKLEVYKINHKKLIIDNLDPTLNVPIDLGEREMNSEKFFNLNFKLIKLGESIYSTGRALNEDESAFVIFQNLEDSDIVKVMEITPENQYNLSIELTTGNYSVEGFAIHDKPIHIPQEVFCYKTGLFSGKECQSIPEMNLDSWVMGALELKRFEISLYDVYNANTISVSLIDLGIPSNYGDLEKLSNSLTDLGGASEGLKPTFSK